RSRCAPVALLNRRAHRWSSAVLSPVYRDRVSIRAPRALLNHRCEVLDHARVAEGVGLHPSEIQELGDALIRRAYELGVHLRVDGAVPNLLEAVALEEVDLEGQAEQPAEPERARIRLELGEQRVPDALVQPGRRDRER